MNKCVDCGKPVKNKTTKRCQGCYFAYRKRTPVTYSDESKEKIRQKALERYADPAFKEKWRAGIDRRSTDPEWKRKQLEGTRRRNADPVYQEKLRAGIKNRTESQEWRESMKDNPCWQRGEKHPSWEGGGDPRNHWQNREWRKKVFKRDDYTCQKCHKHGVYLHAHHIKGWAKYPDLRYDVSNGLTVCSKCHSEIHGHYIPPYPKTY